MSILNKLTEGIVSRDLQQEGAALLNKWEKTGLLEGIDNNSNKNTMAVLLENQAKELLRESSSMAGGDVEGFAAVAFPIVRRVFGSLIANDLVSVQPMSLPSGLIFFLDFTTSTDGAGLPRLGYPHSGSSEESLYGGSQVASQLTGGVSLSGSYAESGPYGLNTGYSSPTGSATLTLTAVHSGTFGGTGSTSDLGGITQAQFDHVICQGDPDFISGTTNVLVKKAQIIGTTTLTDLPKLNKDQLQQITIHTTAAEAGSALTGSGYDSGQLQAKRLTMFSGSTIDNHGDRTSSHILLYFVDYRGAFTLNTMDTDKATVKVTYPLMDQFETGGATGSVKGGGTWGLEGEENIPEIDIKVDSIAVTAVTKKLKAKWTPELGQDLNAYHNLDAEVELTSILSEQIALEIDREILADLVKGAQADTIHWSRRPGKFLDRNTGRPIGDDLANESLLGADFTGTVSEWYETLVEAINDVSAQIHRKVLRGGANFVVVSPEVANILEFTAGFRANVTHDSDKGTVGAVNTGSLSKKWDVYVDPYFIRNVVLVGRKGGSFLESGYVYAPYVPLQVTPTIFGTEDFVPRKGVMTRYAKKMVRPDMYGLVIVQDLAG